MMIAFKLLGPIELQINGKICTPSAGKVRQVLALTLIRANQVVSVDAIIEELWGDRPPRSAVTTVQTYIYHIRKTIARHSDAGLAGNLLRTMPPGYLMHVDTDCIDLWRFEAAVAQAQELLSSARAEPARALLAEALEMWHGGVLVGTDHGRYLQAHAANLEEKRMLAVELRLWADMLLGRYRDLIPELKSLVLAFPYNEWLHAQLMTALYQSGRRGEALRTYQAARRLLNEELGLEPSAYLQQVHQRVLNAEPMLAPYDHDSPPPVRHRWDPRALWSQTWLRAG